MLDRRASLSAVQIGFIDNICTGLYTDMALLDSSLVPMLNGCLANREKWASMDHQTDEEKERSRIEP